jgi:hypothetical protein
MGASQSLRGLPNDDGTAAPVELPSARKGKKTMTIHDTILIEGTKHPPRLYTRLTPAALKVLRYYLDIVKESGRNLFRRSLKTTARDVLGNEKKTRTVSTANDCLRQLGFIEWNRGGGNGPGQPCFPNEYWLIFDRIQQEFGQRVNP